MPLKNALPEPRFEETGNFFKVTIFRRRLTMSPDFKDIYELIRQETPLWSKEIEYPSEYSSEEAQMA
jgi:hypothetical protein